MALRKVVQRGDDILNKKSRKVENFDRRLSLLLDDMGETLRHHNGAGLAAPQVGILRRVIVIEPREGELLEFVNPEILEADGEQTGAEGCLSVPGVWGVVTRPNRVKVRAQDREGSFFEHEETELGARALCHEIDHLDGHLFTEKVIEYIDPDAEDDEEPEK